MARREKSKKGPSPSLPQLGRWGERATLITASVVLAAHAGFYYLTEWIVDDALIPARYVYNLSQGIGLVFNNGEPVEGFSSPLWVLLLAPWGSWHEALPAVSQGLSALASVALMAGIYVLGRPFDTGMRGWAALLMAACGPVAVWTVGGLETPLYALIVLSWALTCFGPLSKTHKLAPATVAAAAVCRPEGILLWATTIGAHLLREKGRLNRGALLRFHGPVAAVVAATLVARWVYYGQLVPNTYHAKTGGNVYALARGAVYLAEFFWAHIGLCVLALIGLWSFPRKHVAGLVCAVAVAATFVLWAGGDALPAYRFLVPALPMLALLAAHGAAVVATKLWPARRTLLWAGIVVATCCQLLHGSMTNDHIRPSIERDLVAMQGQHVGLYLNSALPADAVIATNAAGSIPFYSRLKSIDMLGLTDATIARAKVAKMGRGWAGHEKGDGAYVLSRAPDVVLFCSSMGSPVPCFVSDHQLAASPQFAQSYRQETIQAGPVEATLWVRDGVELRPVAQGR